MPEDAPIEDPAQLPESDDEEAVALPAEPAPRGLADLPHVSPSTTIESAAQNALIDRVNHISAAVVRNRDTPIDLGLLQVLAVSVVLTTDANGTAVITFPTPFAAGTTPVVICANGDRNAGSLTFSAGLTDHTQHHSSVRYAADAAVTANTTIRVDYIAIGRRSG